MDQSIKIKGTAIPVPVNIDVSLEDIDADSQRDVSSATLNRNRIRSDVVKISLTYSLNDIDEVSAFLNLISGETFSVEYFDIKSKSRKTTTMYAGPKTYQHIFLNGEWIRGLKVNLTEV